MSDPQSTPRTQLWIGDRIRDNDPRMPNRVLTVTRFEGKKVIASLAWGDRTGETRIALARVYLDRKPRRSGWSLA